MRCPEVTGAISRCPFLHAIKDYHGEDSAERLATNPFVSNAFDAKTLKPILPEDPAGSIAAVFKLFHGKQGPIPLTEAAKRDEPRKKVACPRRSAPTEITINDDELPHQVMMMDGFPAHHPMMASISLSGFGFPLPNLGEFLRNSTNRPKPKTKKKPQKKKSTKPAASTNTTNTTTPNSIKNTTPTPTPESSSSSKCPLSKFLAPAGGLLPLMAASGRLSCPPAIIAMRAVVANLKPVRHLRPQALPIRSLAMAGTAIAANVPCGMWREHTRKFSPEWILAVHATIPFVAMLRKAVLMPRWAILLTIAGAVAGQQVGATLERARLKNMCDGVVEKKTMTMTEKKEKKVAVVVLQQERCGSGGGGDNWFGMKSPWREPARIGVVA